MKPFRRDIERIGHPGKRWFGRPVRVEAMGLFGSLDDGHGKDGDTAPDDDEVPESETCEHWFDPGVLRASCW
jgi:hypothetical protein